MKPQKNLRQRIVALLYLVILIAIAAVLINAVLLKPLNRTSTTPRTFMIGLHGIRQSQRSNNKPDIDLSNHMNVLASEVLTEARVPIKNDGMFNFPVNVSALRTVQADLPEVRSKWRSVPPLLSVQLKNELEKLYGKFSGGADVPFERYFLNVTRSMEIPVDQVLDDLRAPECRALTFFQRLPNVSVIISFYNEHYSVLLRSVHSVLNTVPADLLQQIILIDDASTDDDLQVSLERYLTAIPNVVLRRSTTRLGLIKSRMLGARMASAEVLVFLDAHVQMQPGWIEPLLEGIRRNRTSVALPTVISLDPHTLEQASKLYDFYGSFTWELDYIRVRIPEDVLREKSVTEPIASSTMIGCAFAVDRNYFFELGGYDEGLEVWDGANLEISFRTWMCGGSLQLYRCSKIANVFQSRLLYEVGEDKLYANLKQVAEVWMDDFRQYFIELSRHSPLPIPADESAEVDGRKELQHKLKCQSFDWYLEHVAPNVLVPPKHAVLWGQLKNARTNQCLQSTLYNGYAMFSECSLYLPSQVFFLTEDRHLVHQDSGKCVSVLDAAVMLSECHPSNRSQKWSFSPVFLSPVSQTLLTNIDNRKLVGSLWITQRDQTRKCLMADTRKSTPLQAIVGDCDFDDVRQYFVFSHQIYRHVNLSVHERFLRYRA